MAMSSSAKKKLGVLGIALIGLAIDRGLVFSGGSDASAQAGVADAATPQSTAPKAGSSTDRSVPIAEKLDELRDAIAVVTPDDRDAFRLPEALAPKSAEPQELALPDTVQPVPTQPEPSPLPSFEVSSIIANSTGTKMAVINGLPIRLGETKQGITLIDVSARTATIGYDGRTVDLRLSN